VILACNKKSFHLLSFLVHNFTLQLLRSKYNVPQELEIISIHKYK